MMSQNTANHAIYARLLVSPNQKIPSAPLLPIPAFEEPFTRVLIDCVGPLKTKTGNAYLLTIMCISTRFPEAIPLRNIKTPTIVKALIKFFFHASRTSKSIQSDQGSNFMSGLFQQVVYQLGIAQYRSSAYHPESQGALERFHQTLKNMIRTFVFNLTGTGMMVFTFYFCGPRGCSRIPWF
ncbi:unnamed protein product [Mytilus coruscus]|uniref:Integrase catalytic domain-containing protein n=1 Tax=Mytilus coruscus TaxID=42192 RepID=A0A6J8AJP4_MYTCO|nr:unnamed protein product [Mytilus coruscus]